MLIKPASRRGSSRSTTIAVRVLERFTQRSKAHVRRQRDHIRAHDIAHKHYLQRIHAVFATQVESAATDLFRQDGPAHREHGHRRTPPSAAPIISSGASTPPQVPEPSETAQITDLTKQ